MRNKFLFFNILFLISSTLYCQEILSNKYIEDGLSLYYGVGQMGIRDEYISNEKYSGIVYCFGTYWSKDHTKYLYKIGIEYLYSNELKNNNISSKTKNMLFHQTYLYKTRNEEKSMLALGPSVSIFFLENSPNIAGNNINSNASFLHLGLDGLFHYSFNSKLSFEMFSKLGILSFGSKENNDDSNAKFETPITNTYFDTKVLLNYQPIKLLSFGLGYENHITRMTSWDYYIGVSNNIYILLKVTI